MLKSDNIFVQNHHVSHKTSRLIIRTILALFLSLLVITQFAVNPSQAKAADTTSGGNLFEKTITWGDGTTETVVIDADGNFILDGVQRKLIGFCDSMEYAYGNPYDADNKAILHKELDYLQSKGVRIYEFGLWPWGEDAYDPLLKLFYDHKMLIVPVFNLTSEPGFGTLLTTDFRVDATGTASTFFATWLKHVKSFPNVVSIVIENELDINMTKLGYTLANVTAYMDMLYNYAKANTSIPVVTKFGVLNYDANASTVQNAFLHYSAVPCFDLYFTDASGFTSICNTITNWYSTKTSVSQMWVTEANYAYAREPGYYNATKFTKEMVDAMFSCNVAAIFMFAIQDTNESSSMFFDMSGNPIANTEVLLANVPTWQAGISEAPEDIVEEPSAPTYPVASLTLTNGGSGYISTPTVTISGGNGAGATAVASLSKKVESITVNNGGNDYVTAPKVIITGGGGSGATATATLAPATNTESGVGLDSITVTNGGFGYKSVPKVEINGGGGTGAKAKANLRRSGSRYVVDSITVTNPGSGYTSIPSVTISGGGGGGATAVAQLQPGVGTSVLSVTVTNGGSGYTSAPTITFQSETGTGATAQAALSTGYVSKLTLTNPGGGYTSVPSVTISGGGGTGATAIATLAEANTSETIVLEGVLDTITVTNGGFGYKSVPAVVISGGGGTGATAKAVLRRSGSRYVVASVTITNRGSGYTSAPTVTFSGGGGGGATAIATIR